ncbi:MAG: hypothetical protein QOJ33_1171, partial [Chloroflexota bacterium]|nr:hypothetical protein [Chloroflexota bacterium]
LVEIAPTTTRAPLPRERVRSSALPRRDRSVNEGQLATPLRSFKVRIDCAAGDLTCTGR